MSNSFVLSDFPQCELLAEKTCPVFVQAFALLDSMDGDALDDKARISRTALHFVR